MQSDCGATRSSRPPDRIEDEVPRTLLLKDGTGLEKSTVGETHDSPLVTRPGRSNNSTLLPLEDRESCIADEINFSRHRSSQLDLPSLTGQQVADRIVGVCESEGPGEHQSRNEKQSNRHEQTLWATLYTLLTGRM